ncbi:hypothetical protein [Streptomyces sp. HM190]|uniref:hypothetical protein n=1 Tax=Streptomyces sp. HM190 TaxID=2695266 RepID=UPI0013579F83|nr:hypothetical protein [Streptomyces sp. HM190]
MTHQPESDEDLLRRAFALIGQEAGRPDPVSSTPATERRVSAADPPRGGGGRASDGTGGGTAAHGTAGGTAAGGADGSPSRGAGAGSGAGARGGRTVSDHGPDSRTGAVWWRRRGVVLAGLVSAAALCAGVLGSSLIGDGTTNADSDRSGGGANASGKGQTLLEWIACGRTIAEGDVVAVKPSSEAGRVLVTFDVQDWIKPARGAERIILDVVDPTEARVREPWKEGQHLLVVVPERRDQETDAFQGDQLQWYRAKIEQGLPDAAGTTCPPEWRDTPGQG